MNEKYNCHNKYEYWLAGLVTIPGRKKIRLNALVSDAEELYRMKEDQIKQLSFLTEREKAAIAAGQSISDLKLEQELEYCIQNHIGLILWQDMKYPRRLRNIYDPPYGLYYRGNFPAEEESAVGVVGARNCSSYGRQTAEHIGFYLAKAGVSVISGMALGIDGAAHQGALKAFSSVFAENFTTEDVRLKVRQFAGKTYGILGCGVDVCYPAKHQELYERLIAQGGIISEYPPHTKPLAVQFPRRNRLISGLSDSMIVVEARERSGSLITADFALEQGKDIYAVPGRVTDALSQGTNRLIRQGAGVFLGVGDFLKEMDIFADSIETSSNFQKLSLEKLERLVYSCLDLTPRNLDELMTETGLTLGELMETLESLREKDCVLEVYKNYFIKSDIPV